MTTAAMTIQRCWRAYKVAKDARAKSAARKATPKKGSGKKKK